MADHPSPAADAQRANDDPDYASVIVTAGAVIVAALLRGRSTEVGAD